MGDIVGLIVNIGLVGLVIWAVTTFIPMQENFKKMIYVIVSVALVLYVLSYFGLWHGFAGVGRHR
jgi:hypothetical protein